MPMRFARSVGRPVAGFFARLFAGRGPLLTALLVVVAVAALGTAAAAAWFTHDFTSRLPGRDDIAGVSDMARSTTLYDAADRPVFTIFKEQRIEVPLSEISPNMIKAVLSIEDQRFFDHRGIDVVRVTGAALANVRAGRAAQGGSTITQQLARQSFLTRDKTLRRKVQEVLVAAQLEQNYTKEEILHFYLNKVYFGDGFHGVEAASRGYFAKPAKDLDVAEAALLAGLIQAPSLYAPSGNPERALARRGTVLTAMLQSGAIDAATFETAREAELKLENGLQLEEDFGLYFKEQVRRELVERFGWSTVAGGGLRVYTTVDSDLQRAAEKEIETALERIESRRGYPHVTRAKFAAAAEAEAEHDGSPDYLQAAIVVLDPKTGAVRAMVGGRDFHESRFNRAVQARRQPGSAFKPFVFAAALEQGHTPATLLTRLNDPVLTPQGQWVPEDGHSTAAAMTMRQALRVSSNRAAVRVISEVGVDIAVQYTNRFEVGEVPPVPSLALGSGEVTLMSMTTAFAAFADSGLVRTPTLIRRVEDSDGSVLFEHQNEGRRAVSEETAFLMASMLSDVVNHGTGVRARGEGFRLPAAGKTGTTNDYFDGWFVGFTPNVVAGVWVGFDQPRTIVRGGYASEVAVPLWAGVMKSATKGHKPEWIDRPSTIVGIEVCRLSGRRPAAGCGHVQVASEDGTGTRSMIYTEYFVRNTVPSAVCDLHPQPYLHASVDTTPGAPPQVVAGTAGTAPPPPPPAADRGGQQQRQAEGAEQPRRRGFWSRVFGRGGDRDRDDDQRRRDQRRD
jgi:1A family penicillin-binding protein